MKSKIINLHILIFLFSIQVVLCLYEDQIGSFDWRHQYVGKPKFVLFDASSSTVKKVITATEENVIASLKVKDGQIDLVTALGGGTYVRCFTAAVGDLVWEYNVEHASPDSTARLLLQGDQVYILAGNKIVSYDQDRLQEDWTTELSAEHSFMTIVGEELVLAGFTANSHVTITRVTLVGGRIENSMKVPAAWWTAVDSSCQVNSNHLVCIDNTRASLHTLNLARPTTFSTSLWQDLGLEGQRASWQESQESDHVIMYLHPGNTAVLRLKNGGVQLVKLSAGASAVQILEHSQRTVLVDIVKYKANLMQSNAIDVDTGNAIDDLKLNINYPDHHGTPHQIYGMSFKKRDGQPVLKLLIFSEDHSMVMLQTTGKLAWTREEALAGIISVEMVDYPVSPILAKMEDEFGGTENVLAMFAKRLTTQFLQLKEMIMWLQAAVLFPGRSHAHINMEGDVDTRDDADDDITRDEFNLHKMLTVVTRAGKVFGLRSENGKPEWKHYLRNVVPFTHSGEDKMPLFVQRTTAHFPNSPIASVMAKHKITDEAVLYTFDPITGLPVEGMPAAGKELGFELRQVTLVQRMSDDTFIRPILALDKELHYHVYPECLESLVRHMAPSLYMYTCDSTTSSLVGYNIRPQNDRSLIAQSLWSVDLNKDGQSIVQVVGRRDGDHVYSQGVVLGDRSVLYKYVNPNLVVVAAEGVEISNKKKQHFINIYLVDTVTGHIPFHCNHKRAKGPINVVHSEHWVVYSYWSERFRRNELVVLELYEGPQQSNTTSFSSLAPPPAPIVMRQAYIINAHVIAAHQTVTEKGLTSKQIVLALEMGGILGMPKVLLDARRPLAPSQESREEGLIPYIPELPVAYEMMINYNQSVYGIRGIHTAPAGLESTSLVLCYGLDLFFTRVMPSKMFDVLKEDFEYFFIAAVLGGMILVSILARKFAMRKALAKAWK